MAAKSAKRAAKKAAQDAAKAARAAENAKKAAQTVKVAKTAETVEKTEEAAKAVSAAERFYSELDALKLKAQEIPHTLSAEEVRACEAVKLQMKGELSTAGKVSVEEVEKVDEVVKTVGAAEKAVSTTEAIGVVAKPETALKDVDKSATGTSTSNISTQSKRQTPAQKSLHDLAKEAVKSAKNGKSISFKEAQILDEWASEYNVPQHHQAYPGSGEHFPGGNYSDHTHIYNVHVPYSK